MASAVLKPLHLQNHHVGSDYRFQEGMHIVIYLQPQQSPTLCRFCVSTRCGLKCCPWHSLTATIFLQGLDHVMFVTAVDKKLLLRQYHIQLKKSGTKVGNPRGLMAL